MTEDSSDFDDSWTVWILMTKSIFWDTLCFLRLFFVGRFLVVEGGCRFSCGLGLGLSLGLGIGIGFVFSSSWGGMHFFNIHIFSISTTLRKLIKDPYLIRRPRRKLITRPVVNKATPPEVNKATPSNTMEKSSCHPKNGKRLKSCLVRKPLQKHKPYCLPLHQGS